ncbi:unnamed protein product [Withania somnifera]
MYFGYRLPRVPGEIRRSTKERQKRRRPLGSLPTPRCESMGSEQGLDTPVVHAVNDECSPLVYVDRGPG